MYDFRGKVVWVTGSSRGIGEACIKKFAFYHASVVIHFHKEKERALKIQKLIEEKYHVPTLVVQGDICLGLLQKFPQVIIACIEVGEGFFLRKISP